MVIPKVEIRDFRCLEAVSVELRPLTVLIGQNDSGKTSFLAALRSLFWPQMGGRNVGVEDHRLGVEESKPRINVSRADGNHSRIAAESVGIYQLPSSGPAMQSPGVRDGALAPSLGEDASGLPALLDYLLRTDRNRFDQIESTLTRLFPGFAGLRIGAPNPDQRRVQFRIEGGFSIDSDFVSTGSKIMLFFVALAYHPSPPDLVLVEEPENGVHPKRLADIVALLREIASGKHGANRPQIVLTTHSPYLLDRIDLDTDQVIVFERLPDGRRRAEAVDRGRLDRFLKEFLQGEVWYNEGEAGLVSAKPPRMCGAI